MKQKLKLSLLILSLTVFVNALPQSSNHEFNTINPIGVECGQNSNESKCSQLRNSNNSKASSQNSHLVYEEEDTNRNRSSIHNRKPVIDSKNCDNATEYLYPGDNPGDWVCDCKPSNLYIAERQKCYPAYKNYDGICEKGEILVLLNSNPKCVKTDCNENEVLFNGACTKLDDEKGCEYYQKIVPRKLFLTVNPTTFELACIDESNYIICTNDCCKSKDNLINKCLQKN